MNCGACEWIAGEGRITADTPRLLAKSKDAKDETLFLNSSGGDLAAAIELGDTIRALNMSTDVGKTIPDGSGAERTINGKCVSACAIAFLGGVSRSAGEKDIGIRQLFSASAPSIPITKKVTVLDISAQQKLYGRLIDYVIRMGVDPRLVSIAAETPFNQVHFFSTIEANTLKVNWDPTVFSPWRIKPSKNGIVAFSKTKDGLTSVALFCRSDHVPRILITFPLRENWRPDLTAVKGIYPFGLSLPKRLMTFRVKEKIAYWEIKTPGLNPDAIKVSAQNTMSVYADWGYMANQIATYDITARGFKSALRMALRNCISGK